MRVDKFLKVSRIIKRRTVANEACDRGKVFVNGRKAKAGTEIDVGDIIRVEIGETPLEIEVTSISQHVMKEEAKNMYRIL